MALNLILSSSSSSSLPSSLLSPTSPTTAFPTISRLEIKHSKSFNGVELHRPFFVNKTCHLPVVKASSDMDGASPTEIINEAVLDGKTTAVSVEKLPLESKLQERAEQKERMKLAKKIRLRRKRLVRKRHLRKKGRWPPSKMKKLKNV